MSISNGFLFVGKNKNVTTTEPKIKLAQGYMDDFDNIFNDLIGKGQSA